MDKKPVIIFGSKAEARIALDIFNGIDVFPYGVITNDPEKVGTDFNDVSVFGATDDETVLELLKDDATDYFVAWGEIDLRKDVSRAAAGIAKRPPANAIHFAAVVSPYAKLGFGNLMNAGVVVNANTEIGDNNMLHSHVSVEPHARIGSFCTLNAGVKISGNAVLEDEVFVGTGAIIGPGVKVGQGALIGAGSVVLREVDPGAKVFGNPAKEV